MSKQELSITRLKNYLKKNPYIIPSFIVAIGVISIANSLIPISNHSKYLNSCVKTTGIFLSKVPGFRAIDNKGIDAMSVSLCNGSTPQNNNTNDINKK
tara:strand:+ start:51 stop:344 length:294 start_codon:yes stop_codon:yes gene_type:complete